MAENVRKYNESIVNLVNRSNLSITGVEKVISVSETQVHLIALSSTMTVLGNDLAIQKLDVENGILKLSGTVNSIKYNEKKENFIKRVFK